jgi:hypothetical protein
VTSDGCGSAERQRGVALFNRTWEPIGSRADDVRMLHMAHASRFAWSEAPECRPENVVRGEWLCSRVYAVLRWVEPAQWHAYLCLDGCEAARIGDWDLAYAYEALASASSVAGDEVQASE